jgi:hypothetical protein
MRQARYRFFLLPLFFVLACVGAFAQANSEVTGIVTDQTGAVVAGASVKLSDPATGFTRDAESGPTGLYDFSGLNPANYTIKVSAKGFEAFVQTGIVVNVSQTSRSDIKLTLGKETETISVVADALAVQTDSNVVSTLINSEAITSIATEDRNFAALAALGLGVVSALPDNNIPGAFGANFTISVNGLRQSHNIWLIDGGESSDRGGAGGMQIQPSQDAIAEFSMLTSNYPPDYGISSGATISLSLKSGTKSFHGTGWEENRATAYDADPYFNKQTGQARPAMHFNIYGFNAGGPVFIPHVYNSSKQKTFFFVNEEWRKTSSVASSNNNTIPNADLPSALATTGYVDPTYAAPHGSTFTWLQVPNVDPTSAYAATLAGLSTPLTPGGCFQGTKSLDSVSGKMLCAAGQIIPSALVDPNAARYLGAGVLPAPNVTGKDANVASIPLKFTDRNDIVRIDHNFNDKWAILGHYIGEKQNQTEGGPELGWCTCNYNTLQSILISPAHSAAIKLSGAITPNLLLEASINYDGNASAITPSANTFLPSTWTVNPVVPAYAITRKVWPGMYWDSTLPQANGNGIGEDTSTEPYRNAAQDYTPKLDVSYTMGKHAFKFGVSYNRYTKNQMIYGDEQGAYHFGSLSGNTLMDTLLGLSSSYSQDLVAPVRHYVNQTPSAYAMDNWHVTSRLSLQLGLRYDALPHSWERQNLLGNFAQSAYLTGAADAPIWNADGTISSTSPHLYSYLGIQSYINGTGLAGQNNYPVGVVINDYKTLQPRVGFSEDLFGNGKTVIRGGFGTFYERIQGNDIFGVATSAPFNPSLSVNNTEFTNPGTNWATGTAISPANLIFAGGTDSIAQTYKAPAVAMFSLGVQREVVPSVVWVVQYVGNIAWHQNIIDNAVNSLSPSIGTVDVGKLGTPNMLDARYVAGCNCGQSFNNLGGMNAYRQFPGYAGIGQDQNNTNGNYNGFQTGLRVQNRWGLSGELDYTYSHEIDITSYDRTNIDNPWNPKFDKGSGALDRRQIINANYIYTLPFFNKTPGLVKTIAGGWQIAGTVVDETGVPVGVGLSDGGVDPVGLGGGYSNRPNVINPGVKLHYSKKVNDWFDATRIDNNVTPSWLGGNNLGFGNWGKDTLVGPGRVNFTTSVYKNFQIYERASFQLRVSSFNTFNHAEFNGVSIDSGKQTSALNGTYDPRNLEIGGRIVF